MDRNATLQERKFGLTPKERTSWDENGYFVRYDIFASATWSSRLVQQLTPS